MSDRLSRLRALLEREKLDALLVSSPVDDVLGRHSQNRRYVSGFTGSTGIAVVTAERAVMVVDGRYTEQAERECVPRGFALFAMKGRLKEWLPGLVSEAGLAGKKVGISRADMSYGGYVGFAEAVAELAEGERPELAPAAPVIEELRREKDAEEMASLERAIRIADEACERVVEQVRPGMTEIEVSGMVERAVRELGADAVSFNTIVASGAWGALPHAQPRDVPIGEGDAVTLDMGALVDGYCSDLTRTFVVGEPSERFREVYGVVAAAQEAAIAGIRPGMKGDEAHAFAQGVIDEAGFGEQFVHGLGHGIGLEVHEFPHLGKVSEDVLEVGMVFTIEPGIYIPGWGGVRIEDVVVLEANGPRVLSRARKLTAAGVYA
ncbi:MAG: M24 family metallopeptidase [Tepidiformaceae bacterium]